MNFTPRFLASIIGSVPYTDASEATDVISGYFKEIPCWPQLPKRSYCENMYAQFSENMPGITIDKEHKKIFINTHENFEEALELFYSKYLAEDINYFSISEDYAAGLYEFKRRFLELGSREAKYIKGQIVGPVSFALTVCDQLRQSLYYNEQALDASIKLLSLKAKWQIEFLRELKKDIIIFLDEPYLSSVGSAYVSIEKGKLISDLNEIIDAIHQAGAITGIHCCGNTDWSIIASTKTDIISFDAYNYSDTVLLYPDDINNFITRGGVLAWGLVPTDSNVLKESSQSLLKNIEECFNRLKNKGIKEASLISQSMITPGCGTGSLDIGLSERILKLTSEVSVALRSRYM